MVLGIVPLRLFRSTINSIKGDTLLKSFGIGPVKLFWNTMKYFRLVMHPTAEGIAPAREFARRSNVTRLVNFPMPLGSVPVSPMFLRIKLVYLLLTQVRPVHEEAQGEDGVPSGAHVHPVTPSVSSMFVAAIRSHKGSAESTP